MHIQLKTETFNVNPLKLIIGSVLIQFQYKSPVVESIKHSEYTVFQVKSLLRHGIFQIPLMSCCEGLLRTKGLMRVFRCYIAYIYSM